MPLFERYPAIRVAPCIAAGAGPGRMGAGLFGPDCGAAPATVLVDVPVLLSPVAFASRNRNRFKHRSMEAPCGRPVP